MTHMVEGKKVFYVGKPAWHNLVNPLKDAPSIEHAWRLACPHNLFKLDLQAVSPDGSGTLGVDSHKAIVRDDGKILGIVGDGYELVQPFEAFDFFRPYIETGKVELESGGTLCDGKRMFALAKVKGAQGDIVPGDSINGYFLVYTSFDGSLAHGIQQTNVRVVCHNTLTAAMQGQSAVRFSFKHTAKLQDRIAAAQSDIARMLGLFEGQVDQYKFLASKKASDSELKAYVRCVFEIDDKKEEDISGKMKAKVNRVIDLLDDQAGLELVPAVRGTLWQGYNAVTQYLTHEHGNTDDSRVNGQWFGESARVNARALNIALNA